MTPEEILENSIGYNQYGEHCVLLSDALQAMKEYGDQRFIEGRDKALELAAVSAFVDIHYHRGRYDGSYVNKESILNLKFHKDLQP